MAGIGLGMKAPVQRVIVFPLALRAHLKATHGGSGTVVRNILNDGEARAAISAVSKWVAVAPIVRREKLVLAFPTGSDIRGDQLVFPLLGMALSDVEAGITLRGKRDCGDLLDAGHRWGFSFKPSEESV
jgi:hypothetical protein